MRLSRYQLQQLLVRALCQLLLHRRKAQDLAQASNTHAEGPGRPVLAQVLQVLLDVLLLQQVCYQNLAAACSAEACCI
jgi:hypothetical protein